MVVKDLSEDKVSENNLTSSISHDDSEEKKQWIASVTANKIEKNKINKRISIDITDEDLKSGGDLPTVEEHQDILQRLKNSQEIIHEIGRRSSETSSSIQEQLKDFKSNSKSFDSKLEKSMSSESETSSVVTSEEKIRKETESIVSEKETYSFRESHMNREYSNESSSS